MVPRRCVAIAAAGAVLVLLPGAGFALDPERSLAQFHHTSWTAKDGAPSQISAIAQTNDGFLWLGTSRGLYRFDGVQFERYEPPAPVALPAHNIYALQPTPDGGLWISFRPSGLGFLKDATLTVYDRPEDIPSSQVYVFACDREGRVWAGTHDGLALRSGSQWMEVGDDWGLPRARIWSLFVDSDGALWVGISNELWFLRRASRKFEFMEHVPRGIRDMAQAKDGAIWIAENKRPLRRLGRGDELPWQHAAGVQVENKDLLFDRDGALWLTNANGLLRVRQPGHVAPLEAEDAIVESLRVEDGLSGYRGSLLEDKEGTIWVGTSKGVDRFRHSHLVPVRLPAEQEALTLMAGDDGEVWVGNAVHRTIVQVRGNRVIVHRAPNASSVYRDANGDVWWGGAGILSRQRGVTFEVFRQPPDLRMGDAIDWMWEVIRAEDGLWIGVGDQGLVHFKDGVWTRRPPPAGLLTRVPSATYQDTMGRIWFGYTENRAALLDRDHVTRFTGEDGIDIGRIRVIRGRGATVWFGGELGLAVFQDGRFRSVLMHTGERFGTVSGLIETADGTLWLNEMRGIVRIPPDEVRSVVADPGHRVSYQLLDFLDGLPGAPQMNFTVSTAVEATDGRLWFATDHGLAWIHPARIRTNDEPPPVTIRSISADSVSYEPSAGLRLPKRPASVRIDYTALSLSIPERVRFRYRLEGYDEDWRDAGNRRTAFYTHLRPGKYRFQVLASNHDGAWNMTGASTLFSVAPAFYQTTWFTASCVLAALASLWLIYLLRVRQVSARMQRLHDERVDERMRIAHELHDTLLQGVLSASMQLHVAAGAMSADSPAKPHVNRVLTLMGQLIGEARDTVRSLRSSGGETHLDLEQAFARIQQEFPAVGRSGFRVVVNGKPVELQPVIRDEIYRIGRESLLNAFRHANAEAVEVELNYLPDGLTLIVRDDGCGIDPAVLQTGREGHWGIAGMRERAGRMGAKLSVRSRVGSGTEVELSVPGRIALRNGSQAGFLVRMGRRLLARAPARDHGQEE